MNYLTSFSSKILLATLMASIILFESCSTVSQQCEITGFNQDIRDNGDGINLKISKIVPLRPDSTTFLSAVQQIELINEKIIVRDENGVYCYNADGTYSHQFGERGNGKGEYINASAFFINDSCQLSLLDAYKRKILNFDMNGKFVSEDKFPDSALDLTFVYYVNKIPNSNELLCTYLINPKHDDLYATFDYKDYHSDVICKSGLKTNGTGELFGKHPVSVSKDGVIYIRPYDNHIYNMNGDIKEILTNSDITISSDETTSYTFMSYLKRYNEDSFSGFTDIFDTERYMLLAFSGMEYTIVDKNTNTCQRYNYNMPKVIKSIPLINIVSSDENKLIGLILPYRTQILDDTKVECEDFKLIQDAVKNADKNYIPSLIFYELH